MEDISSKEVADLKKEVQELRIENDRLKKFIEIVKGITVEQNIEQLLPFIMTKISTSLNADRSSFFMVDWECMNLCTKFAEDLKTEKINIALKMGLVGLCVLTRQLVNTANVCGDTRFNIEVDGITGFRTESILCAPFFGPGGEVTGAVELLNKKTGFFTKDDEQKTLKIASVLTEMSCAAGLNEDKARALVSQLRKSTDCFRSSLFLLKGGEKKLSSVVAEGLEDQDIQLSLNLGIAGFVAISGQELNIPDAYADPRFDKSMDEKTGYRTKCILCVPIKNQAGNVFGVIEVINKKDGIFTESDMSLLKMLSSVMAIPIENAMLFHEQHRQFKSVLEVLAASIDAKDSLTAGHSEKVAEYAVGIAQELSFKESEIDVLRVAALLHDYGKLGTNDNILKKTGILTPQEYEHIKQHVVNTRNILNKMHFVHKYRNVPLIASCHHERLDGTGYIEGLEEQEIPFMSKIIAVADVFEALISNRHYRKAFTPQEALEILEQNTGIKFDENIVSALKSYWHKRCCN